MNYITIETPSTDKSVPNPIVQMFTDEQLVGLGNLLLELLDNHADADTIKAKAGYTFVNLLQQWEVETL